MGASGPIESRSDYFKLISVWKLHRKIKIQSLTTHSLEYRSKSEACGPTKNLDRLAKIRTHQNLKRPNNLWQVHNLQGSVHKKKSKHKEVGYTIAQRPIGLFQTLVRHSHTIR